MLLVVRALVPARERTRQPWAFLRLNNVVKSLSASVILPTRDVVSLNAVPLSANVL